ncbi:hypothetical protein FSOLCH5_012120 [Fusarium solani]
MRLAGPSVLRGRLCMPFCRFYSSSRTIQENDVLFLRQQGKRAPKWHLTAPLRADSRIRLSYGGSVNSSDLIGRSVLDTVVDSSGRSVVLHEPSMASYIINSARYATPIYPHDANIIVSLLDLNISRPGEEEYDTDQTPPPFEIFEAGTGMGSLTLHLARALHAGNPTVPPSLRNALCGARYKKRRIRPRPLPPRSQPSTKPTVRIAVLYYTLSIATISTRERRIASFANSAVHSISPPSTSTSAPSTNTSLLDLLRQTTSPSSPMPFSTSPRRTTTPAPSSRPSSPTACSSSSLRPSARSPTSKPGYSVQDSPYVQRGSLSCLSPPRLMVYVTLVAARSGMSRQSFPRISLTVPLCKSCDPELVIA